MQDPTTFQLPFLLRDMLKFEYGARVELVVYSRSFTASTINIVGATREGLFKFTVVTDTSNTGRTDRFNIPDVPIWISVIDRDVSIKQGIVFAKVDLAINSDTIHSFCAGYVYQTKSLTWPPISTETPEPTKGDLDVVFSSDPAAGSDLAVTIPNGETWRILGMSVTLINDATVINRVMQVSFDLKASGKIYAIANMSQPGNAGKLWSFAPPGYGIPSTDSPRGVVLIPQDLILPGTSIIRTEVANLQAGDNLGTMIILRERFISALS